MTGKLATELIVRFEEGADPDRAIDQARYLKSPPEIRHIGLKVPEIRAITKTFLRDHNEIDRERMLVLVEELWATSCHEGRMAAIEVLNARASLLGPDDADLLERLIGDSHTWAYVDSLSATTMGEYETMPSVRRSL